MHIVLCGEGEGVVDDCLNIWYVQTPGRHVSRDQQRHLPALEALHCLCALPLVDVAMNGTGLISAMKKHISIECAGVEVLLEKVQTLLHDDLHDVM